VGKRFHGELLRGGQRKPGGKYFALLREKRKLVESACLSIY